MVDIGISDKITNLWPAPPSRMIEKSGNKKNSSQNKRQQKKDDDESKEDGPGKNFDGYA